MEVRPNIISWVQWCLSLVISYKSCKAGPLLSSFNLKYSLPLNYFNVTLHGNIIGIKIKIANPVLLEYQKTKNYQIIEQYSKQYVLIINYSVIARIIYSL